MCGIVGMVSSSETGFSWNHSKLFNNLLWVNTLRGEDSTGVFGVNKYGNVDYMKTKGDASTLLKDKGYEDFKDSIFRDFQMVVGHNRKATRGSISDENAHPFVEENVILVHNGTLTNHKDLTDELVEVDSHAILHSIVERGYEKTLKEIQGAFTLVWYDSKEKVLRLIRNNERPLFIANTFGAWFFASEKEMLELVLGRDNTKISEMTDCKPGVMYYWKLEDKQNMWYKPYELWSPPKKESTNIILYKKPELKREEYDDPVGSSIYNNTDFPLGTRLLMSVDRAEDFKRSTNEGYSHMFFGTWYMDPSVQMKAWVAPDEITEFSEEEDDDQLLCTAEIMSVISKKGKIILICKKVKPYFPIMDSRNHEMHEDDWIFTDQECEVCKVDMTFADAKEGVFDYKSPMSYTTICKHCLDKGDTKK